MKSARLSKHEIERMARKALAYLNSPAGRRALAKSAREAKAAADVLRRARDIPWERLHEPFTI